MIVSPDKESLRRVFEVAKKDRQRLIAIQIYCDGVKADFPETKVWMDNIIEICISGMKP